MPVKLTVEQLIRVLASQDRESLPERLQTADGAAEFYEQLRKQEELGAFEMEICQQEDTADPESNGLPDWIPLLPDERHIKARDGREFLNTDPDGLIQRFRENGAHLPIDRNHSEFDWMSTQADQRSAGWIVEMEKRGTFAIWGKVEWTEEGAADVRGKYFRYISPAFHVTYTPVGPEEDELPDTITRIVNASIVNLPALRMPGLTAETIAAINKASSTHHTSTPAGIPGQPTTTDKDKTMNLAALISLLGLTSTASEADVMAEIASNKKKADAPPPTADLSEFVPRADYDALKARTEELEAAEVKRQELAQVAEEKRRVEKTEELLDRALKEKKITPASVDYHRQCCSTAEGLKNFEEFIGTAAPVMTQANLDRAQPPGDGVTLTSEEKRRAEECGLTHEEYLASKKDVFNRYPRAAQL